MRAANLIGQSFGRLTVEECIGTIIQGKNTKRKLWKCKCSCGNYTQATTNDLTTGSVISCGCTKKENGIAKRKTHKKDVYGFLRVEEEVGYNSDNRLLYRCTCLRCGGECITSGKQLRNGTTKSCGCLKRDFMAHFGETNFRDLTGETIGFLKVESRAPTRYSALGNQMTMWNCRCLLCGKKTVVSMSSLTVENHTRSCGCLRLSNGELEIQNELNRLCIVNKFDYSFYDLKSPRSDMPLRFDFALFDNENLLQALIEYQGPQHFQKYKDGFGDFQREVTDSIKRDYCKRNNIRLFEINYNEEIIPALHKILFKIYHISYDNPVPSV